MRFILSILVVSLSLAGAARAQASEAATACPTGSPSPDGSIIRPGSECAVTDIRGTSWKFSTGQDQYGNSLIQTDLGAGFQDFTHTQIVEINLGGNLYFQTQAMFSPYKVWTRRNQGNGNFYQVISGSSPLPPKSFLNSTTFTTYQSMADLVEAAAPHQMLTAHMIPPGLPMYVDSGVFRAAGLTFSCDAGVTIGASAAQGQGPFNIQATDTTIKGCEIAYAQAGNYNGPYRGVAINTGATGFVGRDLNIHDNDDGILASGGNGSLTLINVVASHNGCSGCGSGAPGSQHNIYLSWNKSIADTDRFTITGGKSVDVIGGGDPLKLRFASGSVTHFTAAGCTGAYKDCSENWPIDMPCGGDYTFSHMVIERSPNAQNYGMSRFAEEIAIPQNCPAGGRTYSVVFDNVTFIDDGPSDAKHPNFIISCAANCTSLTVKNSRIISNDKASPHAYLAVLGPKTIDGGGNTFYSNRAAAGLAPYPALPPTP